MVNKNIFKSVPSNGIGVKEADTTNAAGGKAYAMSAKNALAQLACTGTFNNTFYATADSQLAEVKKLVSQVDPEFLAKLAIYSRESAFMKDMPAYLTASLIGNPELFSKTFQKVADNIKMVRNIVQIVRSGEVGRKSLGTRPKREIQNKLASYSDVALFKSSVGNSPSLADVIKLTHPRPATEERAALLAYLIDKKHDESKLPTLVKEYELFKKTMEGHVPNVPFEMLTALPLTKDHWKQVAKNATWTQTRMNLNTFARHDVFEDISIIDLLASRLSNPEEVKKAKVFPYQLMTAFLNMDESIPSRIQNALQEAMEIATDNVPTFDCDHVVVTNDVSGSMSSPITGNRGTATSKVSCREVAALIASTVARRNHNAVIMPFAERLYKVPINVRDSIMTNAKKLALNGGGTNCALPLEELVLKKAKVDLVIMISDNESWMGSSYRGTATMTAFRKLQKINPKVKLVTIDLTPNSTSQVSPDKSILQIGGFSDKVFEVIQSFVQAKSVEDGWVKTIEDINIT